MSLVHIQQRAREQSHDTSIMEARTALPLDGGVKCRQPERAEAGRNRSGTTTLSDHQSLGCLNILRVRWVRRVVMKRAKKGKKKNV